MTLHATSRINQPRQEKELSFSKLPVKLKSQGEFQPQMNNKYPLSRKTDLVVHELNDETLVYDLKENEAFCLNETSASVWGLCDGSKSLTEIGKELSEKLKTPVDENLIWLALDQLAKKNLIGHGFEAPVQFESMSRREVIRRAGLATSAALPIVSSIIAPSAAAAASSCVPFQSTGCGPAAACCSGYTCVTTPNPTGRCCTGTGNIANGESAFNASYPFPCFRTSTSTRNIECQNRNGRNCCSGRANHTSSPQTCTNFSGTTAVFSCECIA